MYWFFLSSRVYSASYLLCLGAAYMNVHLRDMQPIVKLTASPLHKEFPLWHARGHAVTTSLSQAFYARSLCFSRGTIIKNQGSLPPNQKHQARRDRPFEETWVLSLTLVGSNSIIRCDMLSAPPHSKLKVTSSRKCKSSSI